MTWAQWHPFGFGALYALVTFQQVSPFGSWTTLLKWLLVLGIATSAIQLITTRICGDAIKSALLSSLIMVPFFFFGDLRMQLEKWLINTPFMDITRLRYLLVTIVVLCLTAAWLIVRSSRKFILLGTYLSVISTAMMAATVFRIVTLPPAPQIPASNTASAPLVLPQDPPDIYYILTDAYTSPESLQKYWHYDDSQFTEFLASQGFRVLKNARGNADFTPRCLATYLDMNYPPHLPDSFAMQARVSYLCKIIEHSEAPARLRASGYQLSAFSIFRVADEPRFYWFPDIGTTSFGEFLLNKTVAGYLNNFRKKAAFADINLKIFSMLPKIAAERTDKPKFVYAHLMMPHQPFLFDRDGRRVLRGMSLGTITKKDYLNQLIYENSLLTNAVAGILKNSRTPPIIIIQGDHGFRAIPGEHRRDEATTILNALYLPNSKDDWIYDGMTPVNTFRMIFNHYFGQNYQYLPDEQRLYLNAEHE